MVLLHGWEAEVVALLGYRDLAGFEDITVGKHFVSEITRDILLEELVTN